MPGPREVGVSITDETLRRATMRELERLDIQLVDRYDAACVLTDDPSASGPVVVIVPATPADCRAALRRVVDGQAAAVVCVDEVASLLAILDAAFAGIGAIGPGVVELSRRAPELTRRQEEVLHELLRGRSNRQIGALLHLSEATVKGEVATISGRLGTDSRAATVAAASALGYGRAGSLV